MAKVGRALWPESRGRILTAFLQAYFATYVDYSFTAGMEDQLDTITGVGQQHTVQLRLSHVGVPCVSARK